MKRRIHWSLFLPSALALAAAGLCVLLWMQQDAFEESFLKLADHVVQLTIPYGQAKEPMKLAFYGEILSALAGLLVALSVFLIVRQFIRRINALAAVREEQARRLEEAVAGKAVALTPGEYRLLELLVTRSGRIHTRGSILDAIQVETKDVSDRTVDVMLAHMRPKLGEWATHIETVRGVGYRLVQ